MDELETLLRQFQPRRPRPLPDPAPSPRRQWPIWIAASGIAAVVVIGVMVARPDPAPAAVASTGQNATIGALNRRAFANAADLDTVLAAMSRAALPDVERSGGALQALSKE
jgi:hypothetical protein